MYTKIVSLLAVAFSVGVAQAASAADMPTKAPIVKAPAVIPFSWNGCYVGGNGGGLWARKDWFDPPSGIFDVRNEPSSWAAGIQAGCNYQTGPFVFGIQGDYDWADASATNVAFPTSTFNTGQQLTSTVRGVASVTGRVGYSWDHLLGYVKGGGAWVRDKYASTNAAGVLLSTASESRSGWTVGVGGEYAFAPRWSAFVEYDYYDFGTRQDSFSLVTTGGLDFNENIRQTINVVKAGINYRFWTGP